MNTPDTTNRKWNRALGLFIESVHRPDSQLRAQAHEEECYNELMWIRDSMIEHGHTLWRREHAREEN